VRAALPAWTAKSTTAMRSRLRGSRPMGAATVRTAGQSTACAPGQILATDFARGNHADQRVHGRPISRHHHQAAGVLVQPVHDASARHQSCTGIAPQAH
jgi:hypothetical protein